MTGAVAAEIFEIHRAFQPSAARLRDGVADLLDTLANGEAAPHVLEHLGHEGNGLEPPVCVQRRENLRRRSNLDQFAGTQSAFVSD
jgi:hypothetical protein